MRYPRDTYTTIDSCRKYVDMVLAFDEQAPAASVVPELSDDKCFASGGM